MGTYAKNTDVSPDRSRAEIERTLMRYGADQFAYMTGREEAAIMFVIDGKRVRFVIKMPSRDEFRYTPERRYERSEAQIQQAWEQASKQRWRALALVVKAKLEAIDAGIAQFDDEFLAYFILPNGKSVSEQIAPQLQEAFEQGGPLALTAGG